MSVNYYAYAVVGCRVEKVDLYQPIYVKCCNHDFDRKAFKFCPHCGKKAFGIETTPIFDETKDSLDGLNITWSTDREYGILGSIVANPEKPKNLSDIDLEKTKAIVKQVLSKHNLWKDENFGLHSVLYCSY